MLASSAISAPPPSAKSTAPSRFSLTTEVISWPYYLIHAQTRAERYCEVEGCSRLAEALCFSVKHRLCRVHHRPYHAPNGEPLPMELMPEFPVWK